MKGWHYAQIVKLTVNGGKEGKGKPHNGEASSPEWRESITSCAVSVTMLSLQAQPPIIENIFFEI